MFLEVVEEYEKESVVVVSMKQIWYDVKETSKLMLVEPYNRLTLVFMFPLHHTIFVSWKLQQPIPSHTPQPLQRTPTSLMIVNLPIT